MMFKKIILSFIFFCSVCFIFTFTIAKNSNKEIYSATVVKVMTGDSLILKYNHQEKLVRVNLANVIAPKLSVPGGIESKKYLRNLIEEKQVLVQPLGKNKYNQIIVNLFLDNEDINYKLIKEGQVSHLSRFAKHSQSIRDYYKYKNAEKDAKYRKIGIWKYKKYSI